jgi:hypothetical protein
MKKIFSLTTALVSLITSATIISTVLPKIGKVDYNSVYAEEQSDEQATENQEQATENKEQQPDETPTESIADNKTNDDTSSNEIVYPDTFASKLTFSNLSDYAINGNTYAFADGTNIIFLAPNTTGDMVVTTYDCGFEVTKLEYIESNLYCADAEGKVYKYPETTLTTSQTITSSASQDINNYFYYVTSDTVLATFNKDDGTLTTFGEGYSLLKKYNDKAYVVKDNTLYCIDGLNLTEVSLEYNNFSMTDSISISDAKTVLKNEYTVKTVTVEGGAYCTEVDLDQLDGAYFKNIKTIKLSGVKSALVLANIGNASIIAMTDGDTVKSYITLTSSLTETAYSLTSADISEGYTLIESGLYASPFISSGTKIVTLPKTTKVTVIEKFSLTFMDTQFYRVSYTDANNQQMIGYVAVSMISPYTYSSEQNQNQSIKNEFSYSTEVQTVSLVLVIVGLVIVAIVYLTAVGTKSSNNDKKKKKNDKEIIIEDASDKN